MSWGTDPAGAEPIAVRRAWGTGPLWVFLALEAAVVAAYFRFPNQPLLLWPPVGLSAVVATVIGVRANRPARRAAWYLMAAAESCFIAGDTSYRVLTVVLHQVNPFPSLADICYLPTYPLFAASLILFIRHRTRTRDSGSLLDALIVTAGLGLLSWVYLIVPYFHAAGLTLLQRVVSIGYPLGDVLVLSMLARLVVGGGLRIVSTRLLVLGGVGLLSADVCYGWIQLNGTWQVGSPIDLGWAAFYIAWGAAALHPSMRQVDEVAGRAAGRLSWVRVACLVCGSLIPPVVLLTESLTGPVDNGATIAVFSAMLFGLVIARLFGILADLRQRQSEAHFRGLIQNASDIIVVVDAAGRIDYATPSLERALGHRVSDITGRPLTDLLHHADAAEVDAVLAAVGARGGDSLPLADWQLARSDGTARSFEVLSNNLLDDPSVAGIVLTMRDVSERRALEQQLAHQAFHDSLTGLANRALFHDRAEQALARARRLGSLTAIIMIDIDDFKDINDTLGHAVGDELLAGVSYRLATTVRAGDTLARFGGDEFAVLAVDIGDAEAAAALAQRILTPFGTPFTVHGQERWASASAGMVLTGGAEADLDVSALLRCADLALYSAKEQGKGRLVRYDSRLHAEMLKRLALRSDLQRAVETDEFFLLYQPVVAIDTGLIIGAEALARWQHPTRGMVQPTDFIGLVEDTGLIVPLGRWILDRAFAQARRWIDEGHTGFVLSVNISGRQLQEPDFVAEVRAMLQYHGLPAAAVTLELTESLLVHDSTAIPHRLAALKELGIKIAIDDFGTGYSSLSYLTQFPIDVLKIDKRFIAGLGAPDPRDGVLAHAIVSLAHTLRLDVVAEGVERTEQRDELWSVGCTQGQGHLYTEPVTPGELSALMSRGARLGPPPIAAPHAGAGGRRHAALSIGPAARDEPGM